MPLVRPLLYFSVPVVSIITYLTVTYLLINELSNFFSTHLRSEVSVDISIHDTMEMHFDIIFPSLGCDDFGIDSLDVSGEQKLERVQDIKKERYKSKVYTSHLTPYRFVSLHSSRLSPDRSHSG